MKSLPSNVIDLRPHLVARNCPPTSMASHAAYGLIRILRASGLMREIVYDVDHADDDGPLRETAWVRVSDLQQCSPSADVRIDDPSEWNFITAHQCDVDRETGSRMIEAAT